MDAYNFILFGDEVLYFECKSVCFSSIKNPF